MKDSMRDLQYLLDTEARLRNERQDVLKKIKVMRGHEPPRCWGEDDCSSMILVSCPWRIDCGTIGSEYDG